MEPDEVTPITRPGRPDQAGAAPTHIEFEDTGEIINAVKAGGVSDSLMTAFVEKAIETFVANGGAPGDGGGGDAADKTLKEIKKHKWIAGLMSLLLGSGGMVGSYYALKARAENNTEAVHTLTKAAKASEPRIEKNAGDIRLIQADISGFGDQVEAVKQQITPIAAGVESLKQVNVDRLEKENAKLERELRRLRREDR